MNISTTLKALLDMPADAFTSDEAKQLFTIAEQVATYNIHSKACLHSPSEVAMFLLNKCRVMEHEQFGMILLDNMNGVMDIVEIGVGTIDKQAVYPREVVKTALKHNARGVILFHNHPSGNSEPSMADRQITNKLKAALDLVDVTVLDHFVFGMSEYTSFADRGWI